VFDTRANIIKLFGMTNELAEADLDRIEEQFALDLGRAHRRPLDKDNAYYPQFEKSLREEAAGMAEHYEVFYCLEKAIRKLIHESVAEDEKNVNWWNANRVPEMIITEVAKRMKKEADAGVTVRSNEPIDYTNFGELGEIIKKNWSIFGAIFNSQKAMERVMANLNTLRSPIAHCSPLAEDEVIRLRLSVRDWFRLMD
jgi:hypothetical protein